LRHVFFSRGRIIHIRKKMKSNNKTIQNILKGILRRVVRRAGIASTQEPALRHLPGLAGGAGTSATGASTRVEARGDILLALPRGITIVDISITHPLAINTLAAAATTAGAAAARREQ
jgi:hypothetical protein